MVPFDHDVSRKDKVSVLIVEDEALIAADVSMRLRSEGYRILGPVASGAEAIHLVSTEKPDVILMDIRIKGDMDGIATAEQILKEHDIPVVFATSYTDQSTLDRANAVNPEAILFKPHDEKEMRTAIYLALQRHRMHRMIRESELRYRELFESNIAGVYRTTLKGNMVDCNLAMARILGFEKTEDVMNHAMSEFYANPIDRDSLIRELRANGKIVEQEVLLRRRDGETIWVSLNLIVRQNDTMVGTALDISGRKALEGRLADQLLFHQKLLDTIPVAVFSRDTEGLYTGCNSTFEKFFNRPREEVVGRSIAQVSADKYARVFEQSDARVVETATAEVFEALTLDGKGVERPVEIHKAALRDTNGRVQGIVGVIVDLTGRKQAETALRASEEKFRLISDNVHDVIILCTPVGDLVYVSPSVRQFGYNPADILGQPIGDFIHPEDASSFDQGFQRAARTQESLVIQARARDLTRGWRTIESSMSQLVSDKGLLILGVFRDISDRLLQAEEMRNRNTELERAVALLQQTQDSLVQSEKLASIGQLTAGIAHEINNPLAFVASNLNRFEEYFDDMQNLLGAWDVLGSSISPGGTVNGMLTRIREEEKRIDLGFIKEDFRRLLDHTRDGAERIKIIVQQLRGFTHMAGKTVVEVDLNNALEETITLTWNELKYKADVVREFGVIPLVSCNAGEIKQVLVNLIVNAGHALGEKGTITLRTRAEENHNIVEVEDSGHGIPQDIINNVFDPFFTTKPVGEGTGLGLWISSTIMRKHNGSLSVRSEVGKGSVFTLSLPLQQQDTPQEA